MNSGNKNRERLTVITLEAGFIRPDSKVRDARVHNSWNSQCNWNTDT